MELATQAANERPAIAGESRRQPRRRVERLGQLHELFRVEASATGRPLDPRPDVVRPTDARPAPFLEQRSGLVRFVEPARDDNRIRLRLERFGQPATGRERGQLGEAGANLRELEEDERTRVHQPPSGGPETLGLRATARRHGRWAHPSPA